MISWFKPKRKYMRELTKAAKAAGAEIIRSDESAIDLRGKVCRWPVLVLCRPSCAINADRSMTNGIAVVAERGGKYQPAWVSANVPELLERAVIPKYGIQAGVGGVTLSCKGASLGPWWTWPENNALIKNMKDCDLDEGRTLTANRGTLKMTEMIK